MIIGSEFSKKNQDLLKTIGRLSKGNGDVRIPVQDIHDELELDRTELSNMLEYLQELGYIKIETIGGPFLYGHITVTESGLKKYRAITGG